MNIQEFTALMGYKGFPSDEVYARAERIYMGAPNVDKKQFAYEYKKFKLSESEIVCDMAEVNEKMTIKIQDLRDDLEHEREINVLHAQELETFRRANNELECERNKIIAEKIDLAIVLLRNGLDEQAIEILGHAYVISLKCSVDIELTKADKNFLIQTFESK